MDLFDQIRPNGKTDAGSEVPGSRQCPHGLRQRGPSINRIHVRRLGKFSEKVK
jgi:hypothetical protein